LPAKRLISLLIAGILAINFAAPAGVRALTSDGFTFIVEDSAVTLTGCDGTCPTNLVLPTTLGGLPVTKVDDGAFPSLGLTSVTLGDSLVSIGQSAFMFNSISTLVVPNSVISIGEQAFGWNPIASLTLGSSVATIGASAFETNRLTTLSLPASLTNLDTYAFLGNQLTSVLFFGNAPVSGSLVFYENPDLTEVLRFPSATGWGATISGVPVVSIEYPAVTLPPTISGSTTIPTTVSATTGTWTGVPAPTYAYAWYRCTSSGSASGAMPAGCAAIDLATSASYDVVDADVGAYLRVRVTATNVGDSTAHFSAATAMISRDVAANTSAPTITGTAKVDATLTAAKGTWSGTPAPTYGYQWYRCSGTGTAADTVPSGCTAIGGATNGTYMVDDLDYAKYLRVRVIGTNTYGSDTKFSATTAKVAASIATNTSAPTISGTASVNGTLSGGRGSWSGYPAPTYTYQWLRCSTSGAAADALQSGCSTITGARSSTYKVTGLDYGKYLRLKVVGTNSLGVDTKYSAATTKIAGLDPANTVAPSISGTPKVGSTVTGVRGTWTGVPTPTLSYQWFRCRSAGSTSSATPTGCTLISAATSSTYRLVAADKTAGYLRLRVTGTSAEGSAVRFSAAVKVQ
jgi:hypothetical protein